MTFLALYLVAASTRVNSISRPGRISAYSPTRRSTITTASAPNTGASASTPSPTAISIGSATSNTVTP